VKLAVVIITWNRRAELLHTLERMRALPAAAAAFIQLLVCSRCPRHRNRLFRLPLGPAPGLLLLTVVLGIAGLSALGSLLGLLAVRGRTRQAALPVLVLPLVSPVIIAATRATATLTQGSTAGIGGWLGLLAAFDAAFLSIGYLVFGHLLED